ncbi:MAG: exosortase C-terminal domain/associated protein EpsI [Candidatus Binatia bacterium]
MKFSKPCLISFVLLAAAGLFLRSISYGEDIPLRKGFADFPLHLAPWTGKEVGFEAKIVQALKVDDYMMRQYSDAQRAPLGLYVGYYKSMRQGATYHSPKNCLPGSGWYFAKTGTTGLDISDRQGSAVEINRYVIQKGLEKQLVLYWYQDRGRILTSEYWAKIYMVLDAVLKNRTDGSLVRITVPFTGEGEETAFRQAKAFAEKIFPLLQDYLPS